MICDRTILGGWEKFQFKHVDGNVYGIKSNRTGKYCKDNKTGNIWKHPFDLQNFDGYRAGVNSY